MLPAPSSGEGFLDSSSPVSTTTTVGELLDRAREAGMLDVANVPAGNYEVVISDAVVVGDGIRPSYSILEGEHKGESFNSFKLNLTPRGVRRMTRILRAWGIQPSREATLADIAAQLRGRRARVRVLLESFKGHELNDVDADSIRLIAEPEPVQPEPY